MALSSPNTATASGDCHLTLNHEMLPRLNSGSTAGWEVREGGGTSAQGWGLGGCEGFVCGADSLEKALEKRLKQKVLSHLLLCNLVTKSSQGSSHSQPLVAMVTKCQSRHGEFSTLDLTPTCSGTQPHIRLIQAEEATANKHKHVGGVHWSCHENHQSLTEKGSDFLIWFFTAREI